MQHIESSTLDFEYLFAYSCRLNKRSGGAVFARRLCKCVKFCFRVATFHDKLRVCV